MLTQTEQNRGTIIVLFVILLTIMMFMIAFAVDVGYVYTTKAELQHAADAAALAAMWEIPKFNKGDITKDDVKQAAIEYGAYHALAEKKNPLIIDDSDITVGCIRNLYDIHSGIVKDDSFTGTDYYNAVEVIVRRKEGLNGPLSLLMGGFTGTKELVLSAKATAYITNQVTMPDQSPLPPGWGEGDPGDEGAIQVAGITYVPTDDPPLWPFTMSAKYYFGWLNALRAGQDYFEIDGETLYLEDNYAYDDKNGTVEKMKDEDKIPEFDIFPINSAPGNFGTINIGNHSFGTPDLEDQILRGITPEEINNTEPSPDGNETFFDFMDGTLQYAESWNYDEDDEGDIDIDTTPYGFEWINGDPGVSWALRKAVEDRIGHKFSMLVYDDRDVRGTGSNTYYKIFKIITVTVMYVGKDKDKEKDKGGGVEETKQILIQATLAELENDGVDFPYDPPPQGNSTGFDGNDFLQPNVPGTTTPISNHSFFVYGLIR